LPEFRISSGLWHANLTWIPAAMAVGSNFLGLLSLLALASAADPNVGQAWVHFPTSAKSAQAKQQFQLAVAHLHNFGFGDARFDQMQTFCCAELSSLQGPRSSVQERLRKLQEAIFC